MRPLSEYIKTYDNINCYADLVWLNYWIEDARGTSQKPRYLLIGDSTARMVRSTFARLSGYIVDMIGLSASVYDQLFLNWVECFFKNNPYDYDAIIVQIGHHGRLSPIRGGNLTDEDYILYRNNIEGLIDYLRQYSRRVLIETVFLCRNPKKSRLALLDRLHLFKYIRPFVKDIPDESTMRFQISKNQKLFEISKEKNVPLLDIASFMDETPFKRIDHVHYEHDAMKVIAQKMIEFIELNQ